MTFAQPFHDYEVLDRVGAGSMGTVFKARHKKLNRIVALKVLKPSLARDVRYVDRLRREARIVASLNHRNIVTGYDLGQESGYHFFVMEFIEGKSLRELLHEWGMFAEDRVLDVAIQITIALDHAFGKGVIHRDIKPANILIDHENVVKLTDMGLAKGPDNLTITRDGATVGTPQYISPEQARSPQEVDVRSDLYSLGATLFHMCTGQPPFRAETMANVLIKVLEERAPSAAGINPDLSDGLNLIIRKLLSKDPNKRYQTPAELLTDLKRVQRSEAPEVDIEDLDSGEEHHSRKRILWAAALITPILATLGWFATADESRSAGPEINPRPEYRRQVIQGLRTDHTVKIGDKLRRIHDLEIGNEVDYQREVLASLREAFEERLADDLPKIFRALHDEGFRGLDWTEPDQVLRRRLADRIQDEFGIEDEQLPRGAQAAYRRQWIKISQAMHGFTQRREAAFKARVNDSVRETLAKLDDGLRSGAIPDAEESLRDASLGFGVVERCPAVAELPAHLKMFVETKRHELETIASGRVDRAYAEQNSLFGKAMQDLETLVAEWRRNPEEALVKLDEFESDLELDYPPQDFRRSEDPWKAARRRLKQIRTGFEAARTEASERGFAKAIKVAYRIAVSGDLKGAKAELQLYADTRHPRFAIHARIFDLMATVRRRLFRALLPSGAAHKRIQDVRMRDGAARTNVEVVQSGAKIVLHAGGTGVPLALLNVRDLVAAAPGFKASLTSDGERAALAVWYVLSRQVGPRLPVGDLVRGEYRAVFLIDLVSDKLDTSLPKPDSLVARESFAAVEKAADDKRWVQARSALGTLRRDHSEFCKQHVAELGKLESAIVHGIALGKLTRRLIERRRLAKMSKIDFEIAADFTVTVGLDIREERLPESNRIGWVQEPGGPVRSAVEGLTLASARGRTLVLPSLLDVDQPVTMVVDLSFAEERAAPRLVFVECHGATVGLGLQRDGVVAVFPVDRGLDPPPDLARQTRKALELASDERVVPGARHRFYFVMRRKRGAKFAVVVKVFLDQEPPRPGDASARGELGEVVVQRRSNPAGAVGITTLAPIIVYAVEFRGKG